jgi:hypothetical protein
MEIKVSQIFTNAQSLVPTLDIHLQIMYYDELEIPVFISGKLIAADGKTLSFLHEVDTREQKFIIPHLTKAEINKIYSNATKKYPYTTIVSCQLSKQAVDHIESLREKDLKKAVRFQFSFVLKYLYTATEDYNSNDSKITVSSTRMQITRQYINEFVISQNDWLSDYAQRLGIGNFLLIEFNVPQRQVVPDNWVKLYDKLYTQIHQMEHAIRKGEWEDVMEEGRRFYENIKIGDEKKQHIVFEEELKILFEKDQHSPQGFQDFMDGIWKFFEYISNFIHDKDKQGSLLVRPNPTKEEAYFAYILAIGLLNILGKKLARSK